MRLRLPIWLARQLYSRENRRHSKVYALVRFAIPAIALSLAVMLLGIAIMDGFQYSVRDTVRLVTGDVILCEYGKQPIDLDNVITLTPQMTQRMSEMPEIVSVRPVRTAVGMIKTDSTYQGVAVTGVDDFTFLEPLCAMGDLSETTLAEGANPIVLPKASAQKLGLTIGDKVVLYFLGDKVSVRSFTLIAILELTNTAQPLAYVTNDLLGRVGDWQQDQYTRIEILAKNRDRSLLDMETSLSDQLIQSLSEPGVTKEMLGIYTGSQINGGVYQWIDSLRPNVQILLVLMALVAAFTMINALLIIILDLTQTIGLLKALGMTYRSLTTMSLTIALRIIAWGMLWGNLLAGIIIWSQHQWQWLTLDPNVYYISHVAMHIRPAAWIVVNVATLLLCLLLLLLPARIIQRISPTTALRFE